MRDPGNEVVVALFMLVCALVGNEISEELLFGVSPRSLQWESKTCELVYLRVRTCDIFSLSRWHVLEFSGLSWSLGSFV